MRLTFFTINRFLAGVVALIISAGFFIACDGEDPEKPLSYESIHNVKVLEFLPAPGQFVNSGYEAYDMESACRYAEETINKGGFVSLGSFGGRIVVAFDHKILSDGGYDFGIKGNSTPSSSEPGIVFVSEDINANGICDDPWYEIKGSLYDDPSTRKEYSITYYQTEDSLPGDISFRDCDGREGTLPHLGSFHPQSYYPLWVKQQSYTLSGPLLKARNYDSSGTGSMWINPSYGSGYADNHDPDNTYEKYTLFSISSAVDSEGHSVNLSGIDFIKVQTGVLAVSGWLGEASTEVCGFMDYNGQIAASENL